MARIRSIKPQFFTSEQIAECSPNVRLLFVGMWCFCDDYGVHPASEMRLKMEVFPSDSFSKDEIRSMVDELIAHGLLVEYEVGNSLYWYVTGWDRHQKPDTRTGLYPRPDGVIGSKIRRMNAEHSPNERRTFADHSPTEKEKEKEKDKTPIVPKDDGFATFWKAYPKKIGKGAAEKAWTKARINGNLQSVISAIAKQKTSEQWKKDNGQYIPNPATWINQRRWEDELETHEQSQSAFAGAV